MAIPEGIKQTDEMNLNHIHYPQVDHTTINEEWDLNKITYFESANQLKHLQDIEDNLVEALVLNRKAMSRANEQRLAFSRTTIEPDDLINERKIRLLGVDRQSMMEDENFDQWFGENIVMLKGSNDEL
tara:strand:- start:995 stop:1378 length:384 start_codon:yes stop_codon:yes gene_type:complete